MSRRFYLWTVITLFAAACATVPGADYPKRESAALAHPEATRLGREVAAKPDASLDQSGFRLLSDGVDSFLIRAEMTTAAERTLDIQYFIFQDDETGKLLVDSLLRAAGRNVRVRLLLDDADDVTKNPRIAALAAQPNIEVRVFNPFITRAPLGVLRYAEYVLTATRVNYRMHNKLFIADNSLAVVGGRNIGDEYFATNHAIRFRDFDVLAVGPVVPRLSEVFDAYWNCDLAIPLQALTGGPRADHAPSEPSATSPAPDAPGAADAGGVSRSETRLAQRMASGEPLATLLRSPDTFVRAHAEVLADTPEKREAETDGGPGPLMRRRLVAAIDGVQSELLISSPYLVPGEGGMKLLERTRERGVQVRIVTNSLEATEMPIAHVGYQHYRRQLLEDGIELCEMRAVPGDSDPQNPGASHEHRSALHGKVFVLDRKRVFIGSMNFDRRSLRLNTEMGLLIESPPLAQEVAAHFEELTRPSNCYRPVLGPPDPLGRRNLSWWTEDKGKAVELSAEPMGNLLRGFKTELLALLPIDDLL